MPRNTSGRRESNILAQSKKIEKKYSTFSKENKEKILSKIKAYLKAPKNATPKEILKMLRLRDKMDVNRMLDGIVPNYDENFRPGDVVNCRVWRRKILGWFKTNGTPETRGAPLISHKIKEDFRIQLEEVLINELQFRSFLELRNKVLEILHSFGVSEIPQDCYSKRWWYDYLKQNEDIRGLWEQLPKKARAKTGNQTPSVSSEGQTVSTEPGCTIEEEDQISSPEMLSVNPGESQALFHELEEAFAAGDQALWLETSSMIPAEEQSISPEHHSTSAYQNMLTTEENPINQGDIESDDNEINRYDTMVQNPWMDSDENLQSSPKSFLVDFSSMKNLEIDRFFRLGNWSDLESQELDNKFLF